MNGVSKKIRRTAFGGLAAAIIAVLLILSGFFQAADVTLAIAAALMLIPAYEAGGMSLCASVFIAASAVSFLITGFLWGLCFFMLLLGPSVLVGLFSLKLKNRIHSFVVRAGIFSVLSVGFFFAADAVFAITAEEFFGIPRNVKITLIIVFSFLVSVMMGYFTVKTVKRLGNVRPRWYNDIIKNFK